MARADHIVDLVASGIRKDTERVYKVAQAIASDARAKNHAQVAERIERAMRASHQTQSNSLSRSTRLTVRDGSSGIQRRHVERPLSSLFLQDATRKTIQDLVEEQDRADVLRAHGVEPRHRVLLFGPPGNGKTSLAECLSFELSLPLFIVRYDAVVASYLGETAQRLRRLFDFVRNEPCVLFFDEFDAIAKERGDLHETGEIKRVVSTLLLQVEDLPSYCVLIAATNHLELLDRAAWRRFEIQLELVQPTREVLATFFAAVLSHIPDASSDIIKTLSESGSPESFSEAEDIALDLIRHYHLTRGNISFEDLVNLRLDLRAKTRRERGGIPLRFNQ